MIVLCQTDEGKKTKRTRDEKKPLELGRERGETQNCGGGRSLEAPLTRFPLPPSRFGSDEERGTTPTKCREEVVEHGSHPPVPPSKEEIKDLRAPPPPPREGGANDGKWFSSSHSHSLLLLRASDLSSFSSFSSFSSSSSCTSFFLFPFPVPRHLLFFSFTVGDLSLSPLLLQYDMGERRVL